MERLDFVNPQRLEWCLYDSGIAVSECSALTGISEATLQNALHGSASLTFKQLGKLSNLFGRGVLFFLEPGPVLETAVHSHAFRTIANQKAELTPKIKTLIQRAESQKNIFLSLKEDLEDSYFPAFSPPPLDGISAETAGETVRRWIGLGPRNTFDSYRRAVESLGILVFRSNGYLGKWVIEKDSPILGFSLYDESCPVIVVRKRASEAPQCFTLFHELAHILLHRTSSIDENRDFKSTEGREREANIFAANILVPLHLLDEVDDKSKPEDVSLYDNWLLPYRKAWCVSSDVILLRLLAAGRLSKYAYTSYSEWKDTNPPDIPELTGHPTRHRHREPMHIFGDTFVRAVLESLGSRKITLSKASSYLDGLKINDIHSLESIYAGV
jgi:Zn-dependent peptidase ImmA (M78 family)